MRGGARRSKHKSPESRRSSLRSGAMPALSPMNGTKRAAPSPPKDAPAKKRTCVAALSKEAYRQERNRESPSGSSDASGSVDKGKDAAAMNGTAASTSTSLRHINQAALAKINPLEAYEKALTIYRYLANHGGKLFLQRNLGYNRGARAAKATPKASADDAPIHLALDLDSVSDLTGISSPLELSVFLLKLRNYGSQTATSRPELDGSEATLELVGRQRLSVGPDGRSLRGAPVHLPPLGPPNRRLSLWLLFSVAVSRDAESLSGGGRSLRNVPQRRSLRAEMLPEEVRGGSEARLVSVSFLSSVYRPQPTLHRLISLPLLAAPPGLPVNGEALPPATLAALREAQRHSVGQEVGTPHLKIVLRQRQSPASVLNGRPPNGLTGSASKKSPKKTLFKESPSVPPALAFPPRLAYRFGLGVRTTAAAEAEGMLTEADSPERCPICRLALRDLFGLLSHLRLSHARLTFLYKPGEPGQLPTIDVAVNAMFDGACEGSALRPYLLQPQPTPAKTAVSTELIVPSGPKPSFERSLDPFMVPEKAAAESRKDGHSRQYFDSVSLAPSAVATTSDGRGWLSVAMCRALADYTDVNAGEKRLMMAWNLFSVRHANRFISRRSMERACSLFLEEECPALLTEGLGRNVSLHLASLFRRAYLSLPAFHRLSRRLQDMHKAL